MQRKKWETNIRVRRVWMSTSGAVGFMLDGRYMMYYNHFDSYPSDLGVEVVKFCNYIVSGGKISFPNGTDIIDACNSITLDTESIESRLSDLVEKVKKVELVDENGVPSQDQIEMYEEFADIRVGEQRMDNWYCLLRKCQKSHGLYNIAEGKQFHIVDCGDFLSDNSFCEYAYVINLDNYTLEFYDGSKLVGAYPLGSIPENWMDLYNEEEL
jgi:hypothetical protein